jgi:regulator of sigma E protease
MLGGVTVNFILAYFIYVFMSFTYGDTDIKIDSLKGGYLIENPVLLEAGFETGDKVLAINDQKIEKDSEIGQYIISAEQMTVERNGESKVLNLPENFLGQLSDEGSKNLFKYRYPFIVKSVPDSSANKTVDLKEGDIILSLNGKKLDYFDQFEAELNNLKGKTVTAEVMRGDEVFIRDLSVNNDAKLNIFRLIDAKRFTDLGYYEVIQREYTFGQSWAAGGIKFKNTIVNYWSQLKAIFNPKTGAIKGLGGFKAIYDVFPDYWSWQVFWGITAFLSIMLAVLNLLPIPALDGGHVMFLLFEMVSGRKPSEKFLERAQVVGFFILIALVLFANGNDIFKAITR